jgi:prepilin-type N-terminal cleavage/methylation domain-containing protein
MRTRRGFTLIEMMLSVTILLVIMGAAVQFLRRQSNAVAVASRRMDAIQNARYATAEIERELREAGAGVADEQPMIVQADSDAITFNANMTSTDPQDVRSVYRSADADSAAARVMLPVEKLPLPGSTKLYPESTYYASKDVPSGAETISYYLARDGPSTFVLWRRVNARPATLVARNIVRDPADPIPFFTYYRQTDLGDLVPIPGTSLPLYHVPLHQSPEDIGNSALTDQVRMVRVHLMALTIDPLAKQDSMKYRAIETKIRLMNAGLLQLSACGPKPNAVAPPSVTQSSPAPGQHVVTVSWSRSADDGGGEKDIERYAIFRRLASSTESGDPIASIPASAVGTGYTYVDLTPQPGATYQYGIAAQDCTPKMSDISMSGSIQIPNP